MRRRAQGGEGDLLEEAQRISAREWQAAPCTWTVLNPEQ